MRNSAWVVGALVAVALSGCWPEDPPESLLVEVAQHPLGGRNVGSISCTYNVGYFLVEDPHKDYTPPRGVDLKVSFLNEKGGTYSAQTIHFDEKSSTDPLTLSFAAPQGLFLDKTFWAVFAWNDSGGDHKLESQKAICTVQ